MFRKGSLRAGAYIQKSRYQGKKCAIFYFEKFYTITIEVNLVQAHGHDTLYLASRNSSSRNISYFGKNQYFVRDI